MHPRSNSAVNSALKNLIRSSGMLSGPSVMGQRVAFCPVLSVVLRGFSLVLFPVVVVVVVAGGILV